MCINLPKIRILATGGTIAGSANSETNLTEYKAASLSAQELINAVPSIVELAQVTAEQIANVASEDFTFNILLKLAKRIDEILKNDDCDGIVVTHGTDTLEETAYFLNLVVKSKKPVIIVGSMRPATAISADGPLNLLNAVSVAASKEAYGKGVLIVLDGQIIAGRDGTKSNTVSTETFRAHELGSLGYVVNFTPFFYRNVIRAHTLESEFFINELLEIQELPRVDIVYEYLDVSTRMYEALIESKPDGIVIAATGNGCLSQHALELFSHAERKGITVVRSSRTGSGLITPSKIDFENGFISSDNLNPQKARILLTLALTKTKETQAIRDMFAKY